MTDSIETRQDVCQACEYQVLSVPIACELVTKVRHGKPQPCSGKLRQMMQTPGAMCPHPDSDWAARWNAAELLPVPSTIIGDVTTPEAKDDPQSNMTRCERATANRKVDPAELERRTRDRAARRGNSNRAFHVHRIDTQGNPARAIPHA